MKINVAIASSEEYSIYSKIALMSLFEHNAQHDINVFYGYLDDKMYSFILDLDEWAKKEGNRVFPIKIRQCCKENDIDCGMWAPITYARYAMFNCIPKKIDRVMYLATNTMIKGDVSSLYNLDLRNNTIGGVVLYKYPDYSKNQKHLSHVNEVMKKNGATFDYKTWIVPSVLIIDLNKWREKFQYKKFVDIIKNHRFQYLDEEALNVYFDKNKIAIEKGIYSTLSFCPEEFDKQERQKALVVHFPGDTKPWLHYREDDFSTEWWNYAQHSAYFDEIIKKMSIELRKKKERYQDYAKKKYNMLDNYVKLKEKNINYLTYLLPNKNIKSVILYGYGTMAKHIISDLTKENINISCIVDGLSLSKDSIFISDFVYKKEHYKDSDCVILTVADNSNITGYLEKELDVPIVDLNLLFEKLLEDE